MCYLKIVFIMLSASLIGCMGNFERESQRPNIIIMQADDLGWDDLPLNDNKFVNTPGLDRLAEKSVYTNRFYVNPVCAPTRASLLTGRDFLMTEL